MTGESLIPNNDSFEPVLLMHSSMQFTTQDQWISTGYKQNKLKLIGSNPIKIQIESLYQNPVLH